MRMVQPAAHFGRRCPVGVLVRIFVVAGVALLPRTAPAGLSTNAPIAEVVSPIFNPPPDEPLPQNVPGPFQPTWDSLSAYRCPDWFRDAKFGIWAHWSAQCVPEQGDWYAMHMYQEHAKQRDGTTYKPTPGYLYQVALDPADLYGPAGAARTAEAKSRYDRKFYNRVIQLIDDYQPDMIYFDDSRMPISDEIGLNIAAHFYNSSIQQNDGHNQAVMTTKNLNAAQQKCVVLDIERGVSPSILPNPWQTDTCIGQWHYSRSLYDHNGYKSAITVMQMLVDIVSKNGNLMLSVPVRGDGTIDEKERKVVSDIGDWMAINREAIFGSRPWIVAGEGPVMDAALAQTISAAKPVGGFNEGKAINTSADIRFTTQGNVLYAIPMLWPADGKVTIKSLAENSAKHPGAIGAVELLGSRAPVQWQRDKEGLVITGPIQPPCAGPCVLKITPKS